jgi:hypothetical protein
MAESKYGKNIITELKLKTPAPWDPVFSPEEMTNILSLDNNVLKGSMYVETVWMLPPVSKRRSGDSHSHDFDEVLGFFGSNPDDPHDLGGEVDVNIGGEVHNVNKSCLIFVPKGVKHGPLNFKNLKRPIFHFSCGTTTKYE